MAFTKFECWLDIFAFTTMFFVSYAMIYSPQVEHIKVLIPLICFISGFKISDALYDLKEFKKEVSKKDLKNFEKATRLILKKRYEAKK